ncbi:MAG: hypothetical protein V3V08_14250 [Nannocystaceae bacterium]
MTFFEPGCWCGSGAPVSECHGKRGQERQRSVKELWHNVQATAAHETCFHPEASAAVCDQIVRAHSIQRSGVLDRLIDDTKHVLHFDQGTKVDAGVPAARRIGWKQASSFKGFCGKHDGSTFAPVEQVPFTGSAEQCFLIAYRALCHEIHQKIGALRALRTTLLRHGDAGMPDNVQQQRQRKLRGIQSEMQRGLRDFFTLKDEMDSHLLSGEYGQWQGVVVRFQGELSVAVTGMVSPDRTMDGEPLQNVADPNHRQESLLLGTVVTDDGAGVVLLWHRDDSIPTRFLESLLADVEHLPSLLVQFIFAYIENVYFSASWWDSVTPAMQHHVAALAGIRDAYATEISYVRAPLVPWTNVTTSWV